MSNFAEASGTKRTAACETPGQVTESWASPGGLMLIGGNFGRSTSEVLTDDGQSTMHWDPAWPASDETIKYHIISSPS